VPDATDRAAHSETRGDFSVILLVSLSLLLLLVVRARAAQRMAAGRREISTLSPQS